MRSILAITGCKPSRTRHNQELSGESWIFEAPCSAIRVGRSMLHSWTSDDLAGLSCSRLKALTLVAVETNNRVPSSLTAASEIFESPLTTIVLSSLRSLLRSRSPPAALKMSLALFRRTQMCTALSHQLTMKRAFGALAMGGC